MVTRETLIATGAGRQRSSLVALEIFPFLLVPVLVYNLLALFAGGTVPGTDTPRVLAGIDAPAFTVTMLSRVQFSLSWGDLLLTVAIVFLFVEVIKSTRTSASAITNHIISMVLFVVCLIEFLLLPSFATSTFFLLTMMVLVDALAGMVVTIVSARRDFGIENN